MHHTPIPWIANQDGTQGWAYNPVVGCRRCSPGCGNGKEGGCYAERLAGTRLRHLPRYRELTEQTAHGPRWSGKVNVSAMELLAPLRKRKPSRVFVVDMGDLFFNAVTNEQIAYVFAVMAACPHLEFFVLTKRAERMREWLSCAEGHVYAAGEQLAASQGWCHANEGEHWPLPNVAIGVTAENQEMADKRMPELLATPAAVRFVSIEPQLGPVDLSRVGSMPDWVICGCESGPRRRPFFIEWAGSLRDQCRRADVPFFLKQMPNEEGHVVSCPPLDGRRWTQMPEVVR
jgi:protein gp37